MQFFLLTMPFITLGIGVGGLHDFVGHRCFIDIPFWDSLLGVMLPLCMAAIACGACCWGIARWLFMVRLIARRGISIGPELQGVADRLSKKQKIPSPRVLLCISDRPLALTCGIFRPIILLSTWMVEYLDQQELEAVLAHELQHVARRDSLMILLATILRDAFFYIPTSWIVYRQLQQEKELLCDEQAVGLTHRPLALASALAKVWLQALDEPGLAKMSAAQSLVGADASIHGRIQRLLASPNVMKTPSASPLTIFVSVAAAVTILLVQGANFFLILVIMGCIPFALLGKLF
jgi:beta-lactamase regulating signal transducer with metallopeptidase domain